MRSVFGSRLHVSSVLVEPGHWCQTYERQKKKKRIIRAHIRRTVSGGIYHSLWLIGASGHTSNNKTHSAYYSIWWFFHKFCDAPRVECFDIQNCRYINQLCWNVILLPPNIQNHQPIQQIYSIWWDHPWCTTTIRWYGMNQSLWLFATILGQQQTKYVNMRGISRKRKCPTTLLMHTDKFSSRRNIHPGLTVEWIHRFQSLLCSAQMVTTIAYFTTAKNW